jgi:hypothetical protein
MSSAGLTAVLWVCAIWGFTSSDEEVEGGMELVSVDVPSEHNPLRDEEIKNKSSTIKQFSSKRPMLNALI